MFNKLLVHDKSYFQCPEPHETWYTSSLRHSPGLFFGKFQKFKKFIPKNSFSLFWDLEKIHSRSSNFWYTINRASNVWNRMKLGTYLPYVIPQDCFLEISRNSKYFAQKNRFSRILGLRKNSLTFTKLFVHNSSYF